MNTLFLLMAQYSGQAIIPLDTVCRDLFLPPEVANFLRKQSLGEIDMPLVRMEASQKSARGVHVADLAAYIDKRREAALRELKAMQA